MSSKILRNIFGNLITIFNKIYFFLTVNLAYGLPAIRFSIAPWAGLLKSMALLNY